MPLGKAVARQTPVVQDVYLRRCSCYAMPGSVACQICHTNLSVLYPHLCRTSMLTCFNHLPVQHGVHALTFTVHTATASVCPGLVNTTPFHQLVVVERS